MKRLLLGLVLIVAAGAEPALVPYAPIKPIEGTIRVSGSPADAGLLKLWEDGFRRFHPNARFMPSLHGPESTMAGIYTDTADLALLAREMRLPVESMAFEWVKLYKPVTLVVANAGVRTDRPAACLAVFVHPDNPIAGITLGQLAAIFGGDPARPAIARTWRDVGVQGALAGREIHPLGPAIDSTDAIYFRRTVLDNNFKWNAALREFDQVKDAVAALRRDPAGIAFAPLAAAGDGAGLRCLPVAASAPGPCVALDELSVRNGTYPLSRTLTVAYDRNPSRPLEPRLEEFLRFILSAQGQAAVTADAAYVTLSPAAAATQAARID